MNLLSLGAECQNKIPIKASKDIAIVETAYGKVRGFIHHGVYTFKGIPYGKAKRFMPAEKPESWEGVRSSMSYGAVCPYAQSPALEDEFEFALQRDRGYYIDENCLNLNIWSKKINDAEKKPVMVWLHGGGFSSGSSMEFPSTDGESLSRKGDVVIVSVNHRLNVLGFLDLSAYGEKYKYSGNAGATDLVLALTWIKENISGFGGDVNNVTIFGQSGGGAKVIALLNAPSATGLFHKAIVQSGSYLRHFIEGNVSKKISNFLLEELKLQPNDVDSLQSLPYEILSAAAERALINAHKTLTARDMPVFGLEWEPVHDGNFIPYQPHEAGALELSKNVPMLIGSCKNEFTPFIPGARNIAMDSVKVKLKDRYQGKTEAYMEAVKKAYPETSRPSDYIDLDFVFRRSVITLADQKKLYSDASPVYNYLFTWQSPVLDYAFKAFHCMDLPFVFNNIQRAEEMTGGGEAAAVLADKMSEAWIRFARTGNPNHPALPNWPAYTTQNGATMLFDNQCEVKNHHDKDLLAVAMED